MGNRAIVRQAGKHTGVYLHWNGGRDSVEAFLHYCKLKGLPEFDTDYGLARFLQVTGNWFGGNSSLGVAVDVWNADAEGLDNGIYDVRGFEIVGRVPDISPFREQRNHDLKEMLLSIDAAQPEQERLGEKFLKANPVATFNLKIGDHVFVRDELKCTYDEFEVVGMGEDRFVNGTKVLGMPFVNRYGDNGDYSHNINNYLRQESYRLVLEDEAE